MARKTTNYTWQNAATKRNLRLQPQLRSASAFLTI